MVVHPYAIEDEPLNATFFRRLFHIPEYGTSAVVFLFRRVQQRVVILRVHLYNLDTCIVHIFSELVFAHSPLVWIHMRRKVVAKFASDRVTVLLEQQAMYSDLETNYSRNNYSLDGDIDDMMNMHVSLRMI